MKLRYKIVIANIIMLIVGWYSFGIISQRFADKVTGENWLDKILTLVLGWKFANKIVIFV